MNELQGRSRNFIDLGIKQSEVSRYSSCTTICMWGAVFLLDCSRFQTLKNADKRKHLISLMKSGGKDHDKTCVRNKLDANMGTNCEYVRKNLLSITNILSECKGVSIYGDIRKTIYAKIYTLDSTDHREPRMEKISGYGVVPKDICIDDKREMYKTSYRTGVGTEYVCALITAFGAYYTSHVYWGQITNGAYLTLVNPANSYRASLHGSM